MHAQQNSRPVMKAIISDFSLMLSLIQPFFFFLFFTRGMDYLTVTLPIPGSILLNMIV